MKWAALATAALPLAAASDFTHDEYASGKVMELMMGAKEVKFTKTSDFYPDTYD